MDHSGIFTLREFKGREVLKLAPDAFVELNGASETRIVSPVFASGGNSLDIKGGISSINIQTGVNPGGNATCNIEIIAPQYRGFHEDYYITLPSGVKIPFFIPMMEIKVYMKGRFLRKPDQTPIYYQVFWGFIKNVSENYSGGFTTFTLMCGDMLSWWRYQTLALVPGVTDASLFSGSTIQSVPTIFKDMNAYEIILKLFTETSYNKFVSPQLSNVGLPPIVGTSRQAATQFGALSKNVIEYWSKKYFFEDGFPNDPNNQEKSKLSSFLEMYGFSGKKDVNELISLFKSRQKSGDPQKTAQSAGERGLVNIDFNILERVQSFGSLDNFKLSFAATTMTKLDIANLVAEQINFEFFLDVTGNFVFKPPFYNLDVKDIETYRIPAKEILNFSAQFNSENLITFLEITGPMYYILGESAEVAGVHVDFNLMARYGLRHQKKQMMYGNTSSELRQIAVAEMGRINGKAFTANLSMPLRPEVRLGYPVYLEHVDSYYYVTGINHSFAYGSSAQTDLILENRRERVYTENGDKILKAHVYRLKESGDIKFNVSDALDREQKIRKFKNVTNSFDTGFFSISPASIAKSSSDAIPKAFPVKPEDEVPVVLVDQTKVVSNELVTFTSKTVPYTDINGFRHIGGFPYGANLKLDEKGRTVRNEVVGEILTGRTSIKTENLIKEPDVRIVSITNTEEGREILVDVSPLTPLDEDSERFFSSGDEILEQTTMPFPEVGIFDPLSPEVQSDDLKSLIVKKKSSDALSTNLQGQFLDNRRPQKKSSNFTLVLDREKIESGNPRTINDLRNNKIASDSIKIVPKSNTPGR